MSLRQQLQDLQEQVEIMKRSGPVNGTLENGHTPMAASLINLVSSKKPKRRSAGPDTRDLDRFSQTYSPRPVSMAVGSTVHRQNLSGSTFNQLDNVELELEIERRNCEHEVVVL